VTQEPPPGAASDRLTRKAIEMRPLETLKAVALATYKEWAAYRSHILVSLFVGPIHFLVQVFIWQAVFGSRETINGLTLEETITYYGVAALVHYLIYDSTDWNLQMLIHTGRFLSFMLRPVSHRLFAFSQKVGHRMLGFWMEFVPVYLLFTFAFRIRLVPAYPVWTILSVGLGFVMLFLIDYCIGMTAFWLTRTRGIRRIFLFLRNVCAGMLIPLVFFPTAVQKVLFFLPFQFVTYVPVRVFLGSYELGGTVLSIPQVVGVQALAVLGMALLSEIVWRLGIRKFTGVGV
jgi:ABC-2 type transport system permease protein